MAAYDPDPANPAGQAADEPRLAADQKLYAYLAERGFRGREYDRFASRLADYGLGVVGSWIDSEIIFRKCRESNPMIKLTPPMNWSAEDRADLAAMTVAVALHRFRASAVKGEGWEPSAGAQITTHFVAICLGVFPNEFRRWLRQRRGDPCQPLDELGDDDEYDAWTPNVHDILLDVMELKDRLTDEDERTKTVVLLTGCGYRQKEIAEILGVTVRAVEGLLHRFRRKGVDE